MAKFQNLRDKLNRYDSLQKELGNLESFQNMPDTSCAAITIVKHHVDDGSVDPRRKNQQVSFYGGFSSLTKEAFNAFLSTQVAKLKVELTKLSTELDILNRGTTK